MFTNLTNVGLELFAHFSDNDNLLVFHKFFTVMSQKDGLDMVLHLTLWFLFNMAILEIYAGWDSGWEVEGEWDDKITWL